MILSFVLKSYNIYSFIKKEIDEDKNMQMLDINSNKSHHTLKKRQTDQYEYTPTKTRCPLLLVADYRFFQEMGGGNTKTTINYLVSFNVTITTK